MASKTWHFDNFTGMHAAVMAAGRNLGFQGYVVQTVFNDKVDAYETRVSDTGGAEQAIIMAKNVDFGGGELTFSSTSVHAGLIERALQAEAIAMGGRDSRLRG